MAYNQSKRRWVYFSQSTITSQQNSILIDQILKEKPKKKKKAIWCAVSKINEHFVQNCLGNQLEITKGISTKQQNKWNWHLKSVRHYIHRKRHEFTREMKVAGNQIRKWKTILELIFHLCLSDCYNLFILFPLAGF